MAISATHPGNDLIAAAGRCLQAGEVLDKLRLTRETYAELEAGRLVIEADTVRAVNDTPGRPSRPQLVAPRDLTRRKLSTTAGRAALLHAIAHIEFNAINLAWDAVYRFHGMPSDYYRDWARVATEEAYHFSLLAERLAALGFAYGDFPAHNGLWEAALDTRHDVLVRMALVPRVLEARGLDVTPGIMARLEASGDRESVALLEIILRDEIGHVAIGTRWFRYLCRQRDCNPDETFQNLLDRYMKGRIKGPFYYDARLKAGFSIEELQGLESLDQSQSDEKQ